MPIWEKCVGLLKGELAPAEFNTWILPLQAIEEGRRVRLFAPNRFVKDWVQKSYQERILEVCQRLSHDEVQDLTFEIGSLRSSGAGETGLGTSNQNGVVAPVDTSGSHNRTDSNLNPEFTFDTFVEGKSNQIARAVAIQIGRNPGTAYNPLFIYGGVGLGKTHLMHAVGNEVLNSNPNARVIYLHSDRFVGEMVKALQHNRIDDFKKRYRYVNALLIDDVQFFAGKERTQEEFFHTFNALFDSRQQIVLTSDCFPKEVPGLDDRLRSRFGWGLTVQIDPPDTETRIAILYSKARLFGVELPEDVAFFVGKAIRSNVRELEGALRRLVANSQFTGVPINLPFAKDALRDMLAAQDRQVSIANIQKTVAEYYKIRVADLLSAKRTRGITRPRQVAMALARELTKHSLPEIGIAFGGRDHTTVLHATNRVKSLREEDSAMEEDYKNLLRILSS
ncbi:MAG: chromosomal replication initiator protein DnaA [Chromatiaceae bacterium]